MPHFAVEIVVGARLLLALAQSAGELSERISVGVRPHAKMESVSRSKS